MWKFGPQDESGLSLRRRLGLSEFHFSVFAYRQRVSEPHRQLMPAGLVEMIPQEHSSWSSVRSD